MSPIALVRSIPDSFHRALVSQGTPRIDVALAKEQHARYLGQLERAGYLVTDVGADPDQPDCVFIEDTALVVGSMAVITRPGAPSRRGEVGPVAAALAEHFALARIEEPGTLDGGDVFLEGDTVYVGRSRRTNGSGIEQLAAVATAQGLRLIDVNVLVGLHLKSVVLPVGGETVVITPGGVDESVLSGLRLRHVATGEGHRFSALPLRDGRLLVTANAPSTAAMLEADGYTVVAIDISEIQAADGGLTCMSILF